jgi:hypothetical protein
VPKCRLEDRSRYQKGLRKQTSRRFAPTSLTAPKSLVIDRIWRCIHMKFLGVDIDKHEE